MIREVVLSVSIASVLLLQLFVIKVLHRSVHEPFYIVFVHV